MSIYIEFAENTSVVQVKADIYVNAASIHPMSDHSWGGVAGAIRLALSQHEASTASLKNDWLKRGQYIPQGQADFVRDENGIPIKLQWPLGKEGFLIHAGAPNTGTHAQREKILKSAYMRVFRHAIDLQKHLQQEITLAIPPLGIGIYANPPEISAKAAFESIDLLRKTEPTANLKIIFALFEGSPASPDMAFKKAFDNYSSSGG